MHRTSHVTPHVFSTAPAGAGRPEYEAWMEGLLAEAPEFGPQTTRELQAVFAPYLPTRVQSTPEPEMDLPHAA